MDSTFFYSLMTGLGLVLLFFTAKFAVRWAIRLAIIALILIALVGAAWLWLNNSHPQPQSKPRSAPTRRASIDRQ